MLSLKLRAHNLLTIQWIVIAWSVICWVNRKRIQLFAAGLDTEKLVRKETCAWTSQNFLRPNLKPSNSEIARHPQGNQMPNESQLTVSHSGLTR
jgi:hypothetical protein